MSKQTFTNRHGHKTKVTMDDVTAPVMAERPLDTVESEPKPTDTAGGRKHILGRPLAISLAVGAAFIAVLLVAFVALGEYQTAAARAATRSVKNDINGAATTKLSGQKAYDATIDNLSVGVACTTSFDAIASIYPRSRSETTACQSLLDRRVQLVMLLREAKASEAYLEGVQRQFATLVGEESAATYAVAATSAELWQKASDELQKSTPPSKLRTSHQELIATTGAIADRWKALAAADAAKDAGAFTAAEQQLATHYQEIRATADEIDAIVAALQTRVSTLARSL